MKTPVCFTSIVLLLALALTAPATVQLDLDATDLPPGAVDEWTSKVSVAGSLSAATPPRAELGTPAISWSPA